MKIAVTGASGLIGSVLCRTLLEKGNEVSGMSRSGISKHLSHRNFTFIKGDILRKGDLQILMEGCDAVIHTAAAIQLGYGFSQSLYDINVTGTQNVLEVAQQMNVSKIIHFSSVHAYNHLPKDQVLNESRDFVFDNVVFYDITKRDSHQLALKAAENGQHVCVVCPSSVIGFPDERPSKIGKAIMDIYNEKVPAVIKGGFDFVDVRDVVDGCLVALEKGVSGESYILSGKYYSLKEFADLILSIKGSQKTLKVLPRFIAHIGLPFIKSYAYFAGKEPLYDATYIKILKEGNPNISHEKANKYLAYSPRDLKLTLTDTIQWFKENNKLQN